MEFILNINKSKIYSNKFFKQMKYKYYQVLQRNFLVYPSEVIS